MPYDLSDFEGPQQPEARRYTGAPIFDDAFPHLALTSAAMGPAPRERSWPQDMGTSRLRKVQQEHLPPWEQEDMDRAVGMGMSTLVPGGLIAKGIASAPKVATGLLAGYYGMAGTDNAGGAEDANAVKQLQTKLRDAGYYRGDIDGKMGPGTQRAQQEFNAAEQQRQASETKARELSNQEGANAAALETARANAKTAEADAERIRLEGIEKERKAQQREQGNKRLTEMENEVPWYRRMLRDYGTAVGLTGGAILGAGVRSGVVKASDAISRRAAERAEKPFAAKLSGTPDRVARVNQFYREGGAKGDVPFTQTPGSAPGFAANPNVAPLETLYQPNKVKDLLTDFGVTGVFGAESAYGMKYSADAREELARATAAANEDPNEINIRALQTAKDNVAIGDALTYGGRAAAAGYWGKALKGTQRSPSVPSGAAAETERMKLENLLRKKTTPAKTRGTPSSTKSQPSGSQSLHGPDTWTST